MASVPAAVLVAYATKHGATAEIAERLAAAVRANGRDAAARPAGDVDDLSGYGGVVLGSAVYMGRWRPEAQRFARRHREALEAMPVWLFSSGPLPSEDGSVPPPPKIPAPLRRLGAREHVTFGGRLPSEAGNFVERAMVKNTPPDRRDARDWAAIDAWGRSVAQQLSAIEGASAGVG